MELMIKAVIAAICAGSAALIIKKDSPAFMPLLGIGAVTVILSGIIHPIREIIDTLYELSEEAGISAPALSAVLKSLGIAVVCRFGADVCKESGLSAAASSVEFVGAVSTVYVTLPLISILLNTIRGLI